MKWYFRRTLDRVLCPFSQHLSVFFSAVVSQIQILGQRIVCHRKQHVCTYFQQAASYCSGQRASSMWRKFPPVCSNYCLQRIAVPPEKRSGREKEPKRSAYIQRTIILSQTAILPPLTKTFRRKEKCSARSLQKDVSETWLLSKSPVIFQILWIIGFGTFGRWHQEWNELRLLFSLFGCEYTIISAFCNVLFFSQFQESLNIKSVRFNRERVWFLSQLC